MKKSLLATLPVAAFVAGMAVVPNTFADEAVEVTSFDTLQQCIDKVVNGDVTCKLTQTVTVNGDKLRLGKVRKPQQANITTPAHTVTIDLNNNKISGTGLNKVLIGVADANMTITGNGAIEYTAEDTSNITINVYGGETSSDGSKLTIGPGVTLTNAGIGVATYGKDPSNYGTVIDFNGSINSTKKGAAGIYVNGSIKNTDAMPQINIGNNANISTPNGMAIYQAGNANTTIGAATITGDTGIGIKAGTLVLNGTNIHATGAAGATDLKTSGIEGTGSALQVESNDPPYAGQIDVVINAGTSLISDNNFAIEAYGAEGSTEGIKEIKIASPDVHLVSAEGKPVASNTATGFTGVTNAEGKIFEFGNTSEWPVATTTPTTPTEPEETITNPNTADSIALYTTIAALSLVGLGTTIFAAKKTRR